MFHIALWEPEIAANTGNIGRLCVATGATLHLIGALGFQLHDRAVRRAGLDYWAEVDLVRHTALADLEAAYPAERIFCFSAHAGLSYTRATFRPGDVLLFGRESRGLPPEVLARHAGRALCVPMPTGKVRSLNLANTVAIVLYEALRQVNGW